jgi:hypothetical protein
MGIFDESAGRYKVSGAHQYRLMTGNLGIAYNLNDAIQMINEVADLGIYTGWTAEEQIAWATEQFNNFAGGGSTGVSVGGTQGGTGTAQSPTSSTQSSSSSGQMINSTSNVEPIPIVYGRTRVGGNRVYIESSDGVGDINGEQYLNMVFSICEGEMGNPYQMYFDDILVWDSSDTGTINASTGEFENFRTTVYTPSLTDSNTKFIWHSGSDDQTVDTVIQNSVGSANWTDDHRLRGVAFLSCKIKANAAVYQGGLPLITIVTNGKSNMETVPTKSGSTTHDVNPVDVLYDYLKNPRYGRGLGDADLDLDSFKSAWDDCNGTYQINGTVDTNVTVYNNVKVILAAMNAYLIYINGKYKIKIKKQNEPSVKTFTTEEILSDVSVTIGGKKGRLNKVVVEYKNDNADKLYNTDIVIDSNATYLAEDNNVELQAKLSYALVNDTTLVENLAQFVLDSSRKTMTVSFKAAHTALKVECGDIITLELPQFGWENGKLFRVLNTVIAGDNTLEFDCLEYDPTLGLV